MKYIYLTGGAFGMIYQMGALSAAKSAAKNKYIFYGCSAGALTAVMTLLGYSDKEMLQIYHDISDRALDKIKTHPFSYNTYNLTPHHFEVFDKVHKDHPDAYKKLTRKMYIGVTLETGFKWFRKFRSNKELFNILLCSFHVPFLCSYNATINGVKCIDGGFGFNAEKHLPSDTLIICPKYTESKYVLNGEMPLKACATPSSLQDRMEYYNKGYDDMNQYLKRGTFTKKNKIDESIVPESVWWLLRKFQLDDTNYVL